jgi:uncharacterized protein
MLLKNIPLEPTDLPSMEEIPHHGHPANFRKELLFLGFLRLSVLLAGPAILLYFGEIFFATLALLLWFFLLVLTIISILKSFPIRGYALRELDISYKKGWIFFSHITIPFNRVQHSEISQGPIDRLFHLVTLHIYTAGGSSSDLSIPGLIREEAERLRDFISAYHE